MLLRRTIKPLKILPAKPLILKIHKILEEVSYRENQPQKLKPLLANLTTTDRAKICIDLNVCRPLPSLTVRCIEKEPNDSDDNLEDLMIIWLDENNELRHEENEYKRKNRLREIVNCLRTFDNVTECFDFIQTIKEEKIFLIISGTLGKASISDIENLSQVLSVYIYCFHGHKHQQWIKDYQKIVGTFTTEDELITQLTRDVSLFFQNYLPVTVIHSIDIKERSMQDLTKDQARFMWSQLLMDTLYHLPKTKHSKEEFIRECRRRYKNNKSQQKKIDEFEKNYKSSSAISWYTRDSFLYRIVNKALRTQNMLYILKCRFFIIDLYQNLKRLHSKFISKACKNVITVYRGQMIAAEEFTTLKMNVNGFIAINTFFSTTYTSTVALDFAGNGSGRPMFESVLFEIEIDSSLHKTPFANVQHISRFNSEKELILSLGTTFRIESVDPITTTIWCIRLISVSEMNTTELDCLARYIKMDISNSSSYLAFGKILQEIGEYDIAEKYYGVLLSELPPYHQDIPAVYTGLGSTIVKTQKNLSQALEYLNQSLLLQVKIFPEKLFLFVETLENIAGVLVERWQYQSALKHYHLILAMFDCVYPKNHSRVLLMRAEVYNNMGYIYSKRNKLDAALHFYKMSHKIERKLLPLSHPSIAVGLNNMATIYVRKANFQLADRYYRKATEIRQKALPFEQHPDLVQMYNNLGTLDYERKHFDQAIMFFKKALEIQLKCLPPVHPQTVTLYNSLGNTYLAKNNYEQALAMYGKALEIGQQCWGPIHIEVSQSYTNMGVAYRHLKDYIRASDNCQKALNVAKQCLPSCHVDLAEAYINLAQVYSDMNDQSMALQTFLQALDIYFN